MHKFILALVTLAAFGGHAHAADVAPQRTYSPAASIAPLPFSWTGGHVGVALGYGFGNREVSADAWDSESSVQIINLDGIGSSGPLGAVTLGGDYDTGSVILRARVDYAISGAESTLNILGNRVATVEKGDEVIAWAGAGLPISADRRTVVYGLAGWASSEFTLKTDDGKASKDYAGLAVALGVEHAFSDMFSASAETQYIDWGKETIARGEGFAAHDDPEEFRVMLGAKVRLKP